MRKSKIAVLGALVFLLLMIVVIMGWARIFIGPRFEGRGDHGAHGHFSNAALIEQDLELSGFDSVVIEGAWKLDIVQRPEFKVEIKYPEGASGEQLATLRGKTLVLGKPSLDSSWDSDWDSRYSAQVQMPALSKLAIDGAGDVVFTGFSEDSLSVSVDGAGRVKAKDSRVADLNVRLKGLGQVDLEDLLSANAEVYLDGAGEVKLHMDGGILGGSLDGLGSIRYAGEVTEQDIELNGLGEVERIS